MAHKKGQGSTKNNRDSESKRLGVKIFGGQPAIPGNIIIRQRGTKVHPGKGVGIGKDYTIYATSEGLVTFTTKKGNRKYVHVLPADERQEVKGAATQEAPVKAKKVVEKKAAPAKKATAKKAPAKKATAKGDDLTKIEGVGPKISQLLQDAGLTTFSKVAEATAEQISEILAEAGSRYSMHNPETWPQQAKLAAADKWDELKELQDKLDGGRK